MFQPLSPGGGVKIIIEIYRGSCSKNLLTKLQFVICTMQSSSKVKIHNCSKCDPRTNNSGPVQSLTKNKGENSYNAIILGIKMQSS